MAVLSALPVTQPYYITELKQMQVLASSGRDDLMDAIHVIGPCTVSELARYVGRSAPSLYYHLKALRDVGLLIETTRKVDGSMARTEYRTPGRPMFLRYDLTNPRKTRAVVAIARARLKSAERGFVAGCGDRERSNPVGPRRNLWVARWKGHLSDEALEEANVLFHRLLDLFQKEGDPDAHSRTLHELTFVIAPGRLKKPSKGAGRKAKRK
jgi:DNA-binding transcriptional ArsR family regulator